MTDKKEKMRQQVDVYLTLDADIELSVGVIEDCIRSSINNIDIEATEVIDIHVYEEAEIYGNTSARQVQKEAVWLLHIDHKYGQNISAHCTKESAEKSLYEYCAQNWDNGLDEQYGKLDTLSSEEAIEAYFDAYNLALDYEWYILKKVEIEG